MTGQLAAVRGRGSSVGRSIAFRMRPTGGRGGPQRSLRTDGRAGSGRPQIVPSCASCFRNSSDAIGRSDWRSRRAEISSKSSARSRRSASLISSDIDSRVSADFRRSTRWRSSSRYTVALPTPAVWLLDGARRAIPHSRDQANTASRSTPRNGCSSRHGPTSATRVNGDDVVHRKPDWHS